MIKINKIINEIKKIFFQLFIIKILKLTKIMIKDTHKLNRTIKSETESIILHTLNLYLYSS